jgi:hypothetical protein
MIDTTAHDEKNVLIDTDGPLPLRVKTLANIPAAKRECYFAEMDGEHFRLAFIRADDHESLLAHADLIATGKIRGLDDIEIPELKSERERRGRELAAKALSIADAADVADRAKERDAAFEREQQALKEKYGLVSATKSDANISVEELVRRYSPQE